MARAKAKAKSVKGQNPARSNGLNQPDEDEFVVELTDEELTMMYKNKVRTWQEAEDMARECLKTTKQRKRAAEKELANHLRKQKLVD